MADRKFRVTADSAEIFRRGMRSSPVSRGHRRPQADHSYTARNWEPTTTAPPARLAFAGRKAEVQVESTKAARLQHDREPLPSCAPPAAGTEVKAAAEKAAAEAPPRNSAEKAKEAQAKADAEEIKELMGFIQQASEATTLPDVPTALQYYEEAVKWAVGYFERNQRRPPKPTIEKVASRVARSRKRRSQRRRGNARRRQPRRGTTSHHVPHRCGRSSTRRSWWILGRRRWQICAIDDADLDAAGLRSLEKKRFSQRATRDSRLQSG